MRHPTATTLNRITTPQKTHALTHNNNNMLNALLTLFYSMLRDSRSHLSPDRSGERDISPVRRRRLRRQSTSIAGGRAGGRRSPDSSSCSSRDPSPCNRPSVPAPPPEPHSYRPAIRRQSTTEEILIARGFRRQSTTEEMIRCRNFRRQSSQSDDTCRYRGRRDSCAQILDGTIASMTVETSGTFFDSSTQTGR